MNHHYRIYSDSFWNALGHGMNEEEAVQYAAAKVAAYDKYRRHVAPPARQDYRTVLPCNWQ